MVKITGSSVVKTFKYLEAIYKLIETHSIPNTDKFVKAKDETVWLSPRGNVYRPHVEKEVRECLVCILEALVV